MPIKDDFAWERLCRAVDELSAAADELNGLTHLPDGHPHKCDAWSKLKAAQTELERVSKQLEPRFQPS